MRNKKTIVNVKDDSGTILEVIERDPVKKRDGTQFVYYKGFWFQLQGDSIFKSQRKDRI